MNRSTSTLPEPNQVELRTDDSTLRLTLRHLRSDDDYTRCEALQRATWGQEFPQIASATMMKISQKVGGLSAGAFDGDGNLRGLIFGITGLRGGEPGHWSHITAVDAALRGLGLGRHLKAFQRCFLLDTGVEKVYWTYDPLEARNAHLNINRLGAEPVEYHEDFYGDGADNALHRGLGTDRFIVEWRLASPEVEEALREGHRAPEPSSAPVINASPDGKPRTETPDSMPDLPEIRIEVPLDVQTVRDTEPELAIRWRQASRWAFQTYMGRGYRVRAFQRQDGRGFYLLRVS